MAIPAFLRGRGCEVVTKSEKYGHEPVPDVQWLEWCGQDWAGLTKDAAVVRRVKHEMAAVRRFKVRLFYFPNASLTRDTYVAYLDRHWDQIVEQAARPGPLAVAIYADRLC